MRSKEKKNRISPASILAVVLIILKLTGFLKWSWLWVLSPIWIGYTLVAVSAIAYVVFDKMDKHYSKTRQTLEEENAAEESDSKTV